ncbi:MFS transporter [Actinomadura logoneensis]|uniref:MFS transporter n=1 Tax=Actinomadura logoneensis TaxID=2293572 RepID=A0A372JKJ5_9ACTN|nr:MFS transporter [Actinomadura logoneensis]RFU39848.1 MFS transporter [Actinomadura logoneensis]
MAFRLSLGRDFAWLWRAYAVSALGTWLALDAFPMIAVLALHVDAARVSLIAVAGGAAAALLAVPLGPWVEYRPKRALMVNADLVRFGALATVPAAYLLDALTYAHLLVVAVVVAVANIVFVGASGSHLKALVPAGRLGDANGGFESVNWLSTAVGPPAGGALIGLFGPVATVVPNALSFLGSALAIRRIRRPEPAPPERPAGTSRRAETAAGWRVIAASRDLRLLFAHTVLTGALIMAVAPLMTFRMMGDLGFSPLEYGIGIGVPCLGGLLGARVSRPLVARFGSRAVLLGAGVLRLPGVLGLAFVGPGPSGLLVFMVAQLDLIVGSAIFNPAFATLRLQLSGERTTARVLTAWKIGGQVGIAAATLLWAVLAAATDAGTAVATAGVALAGTAFFLPWRPRPTPAPEHDPQTDVQTVQQSPETKNEQTTNADVKPAGGDVEPAGAGVEQTAVQPADASAKQTVVDTADAGAERTAGEPAPHTVGATGRETGIETRPENVAETRSDAEAGAGSVRG